MKIASISFYPYISEAGGVSSAAISFKEWMDILEIKCDLIGVTGQNEIYPNKKNELFPGMKGIDIYNLIETLNEEYDAAYISGFPRINSIKPEKIKIPFIIHVHSEHEHLWYLSTTIENFIKYGIPIYAGKDWYPCCRPKFLIKENSQFVPSEKYGVLYAARISRTKNAELFVNESEKLLIPATMLGDGIDSNLKEKIKNRIYQPFGFSHFNYQQMFNFRCQFYWEYFGGEHYKISNKRLNLSAVEAIAMGMLPIINPPSAPNFIKSLLPHNMSEIYKFHKKFNNSYENLLEAIINSSYSFSSVMSQIIILLEKLYERKRTS